MKFGMTGVIHYLDDFLL